MVFSFLNVYGVNDSNIVSGTSLPFVLLMTLLLCPYFDFPLSLSDLLKT